MKQSLLTIVCFTFFVTVTEAQYYFRGDIKDQGNQPLAFVRIQIVSNNSFYYSGSTGSFGIPSIIENDSAIISINGYETKTVGFNSQLFNHVVLKVSVGNSSAQKKKLLSFTKDKVIDKKIFWSAGGETYSQQLENQFNNTAEFPITGFALGVDKASYSNIRRFLTMKSAVPPNAVRIEEMLNYFPQPPIEIESNQTFAFESQLTNCPWNEKNKLLFIKVQAKKINYELAPPANLVFLIDVSGSMDLTNRLSLIKTAFRLMVPNLRSIDTISIVTYGGTIAIALQPTSGSEQQKILGVIDSLQAAGDTPGGSALRTAYNLIQLKLNRAANNRIILATDGDFNVGETTEEALMQLVAQKQQLGIYLTCLGVGMGNYKDSKLEALAKKGNGNFAYLDNIMEAEKVLVKEIMQTLYVVADDAFLNVSFNSQYIKQYRLIGYDNRKDLLADSTVSLEGGEIGSGHTVTAVFEIELNNNNTPSDLPIATTELNYLHTDLKNKIQEEYTCNPVYTPLLQLSNGYSFSVAVVWFGLLLKQSGFVTADGWSQLLKFIPLSMAPTDYLQNEMKQLIEKANLIYNPPKRKGFFQRKKRSE